MRNVLVLAWVLSVCVGSSLFAQAQKPSQVHVILFVPADVKPPTNYQARMDEIVAYVETFFERELKRWGHEKVVKPFRRDPSGRVEVTMMKGKQKTDQYKPVTVRAEVMDALRAANRIDGARQVWWIMVYAGEPPKRFDGFLGGFGEQIGGWSVCNFAPGSAGRILPTSAMGSELLEKMALKGMIHELGHAFGLPHMGPLDADKAGNTLMGPTHFNYRRVRKADEDRVYLCEAEAAIFATHPAFRGMREHLAHIPTLVVHDLKYTPATRKKAITVSGRVVSPRRAVYALVADEAEDLPGEYWTKTYAAKVGDDGTFEVTVTEPSQAGGTLRTWFVFDNGTQTGDGKNRGRGSGVARKYVHASGKWRVE